jgi:hypothetical protein
MVSNVVTLISFFLSAYDSIVSFNQLKNKDQATYKIHHGVTLWQ